MDVPTFIMRISINVVAELGPLLNIVRYAEKNKASLIESAAKRLLRYQQQRFLRFSRGGGSWAPITDITKRIKEARGYASNPSLILREKDELRHSMGMKLVGNTYHVGFVEAQGHWRSNDYITDTIALAEHHHPTRPVIGYPAEHVKNAMVKDIKLKYQQLIARNRRKKK